jgi:hypothetical protein
MRAHSRMATSPLDHKKQLTQCLIDLSVRANELNEPSIQAILLVLAGSIADGSEDELALLCADDSDDSKL